jgi:hypothetical protein
VHTALTICDTSDWRYDVFYASSSNHGVSWSDLELVNEDTTTEMIWYPDIGADSAGHAYVVWTNANGGEIWFSTNNPFAIAEGPTEPGVSAQPSATVVRNVLALPEATSRKSQAASSLLDVSGRRVMVLKPGANDVRALAPGVYFVREAQAQAQAQAIRKVVVTR